MYLLAKKKEEEKLIGKGVITNNLPFLAKISIIEDEWKDFYEDLSSNIFLLEDVETFFKETLPGKVIPEHIGRHFEMNPGLREFLNATMAVRVDDVKPFLLLNQEACESAIPELKLLKQLVIKNDVNQVRDIMKKVPDNEKPNYVRAILGMCKVFVDNGRYTGGFNCLNIISHVYSMLPDEFHSEVAEDFGSFIDREGIRESLSLFNVGKLFEIFPHMCATTRDSILCSFIHSFFLENCKNIEIVSKLIERSDLIGSEPKKELNDHLIELLISGEPQIAKNLIEIIRKNDIVAEKILEQRTIFKLMENIERIREIENRQQGRLTRSPQIQPPVTTPEMGVPVNVVRAAMNIQCCIGADLITSGQEVLECPFCKVTFHEQCARMKNIQRCPVCSKAIIIQ